MLLKVGVATIAVSLVLAAGVAAALGLRGKTAETAFSTEPRAASEPPAQKWAFDPGQRLEIDGEDKVAAEQGGENVEDAGPSPRVQSAREAVAKQEPEPASLPVPRSRARLAPTPEPVPDWPEPTSKQGYSTQEPRYYQTQSDADMTLTIDALALYDAPIVSSTSLEALDRGLMHEPETSLPWDGGDQRNMFIAGRYLGRPETASHLVFYNLDKLRRGDEIIFEDNLGRTYRYRVSEAFKATRRIRG